MLLEPSTTHTIALNLHDSITRQYHEDPHSLDEETEVQRGKESQVTWLEGGRAECQSHTPPKPCSSLFSVPLWGSRIHSHLHMPPQSPLHSTHRSRAGFWLKALVVVRGLVRVMSVAKIKGALGAVVRVRAMQARIPGFGQGR